MNKIKFGKHSKAKNTSANCADGLKNKSLDCTIKILFKLKKKMKITVKNSTTLGFGTCLNIILTKQRINETAYGMLNVSIKVQSHLVFFSCYFLSAIK